MGACVIESELAIEYQLDFFNTLFREHMLWPSVAYPSKDLCLGCGLSVFPTVVSVNRVLTRIFFWECGSFFSSFYPDLSKSFSRFSIGT